MDNLVFFNVEKIIKDSLIADLICLFIPDAYLNTKPEFYSALTYSLSQCKNLPDGLVVFYTESKSEIVSDAWKDEVERDVFYNRLLKNGSRYTKTLSFVSLSKDGLKLNKSLSENTELYDLKNKDLSSFLKEGIAKLAVKNDVFHQAPSGHNFRHPSGSINKTFIQAKELACNESELMFIAIGIVLLNADFEWDSVEEIFIDSMGIYYLVKAALNFANSRAKITNFHSYSGINNLTKPNGDYLVVISASTSGKMAKKLTTLGFCCNKILTIIDMKEREGISNILITPKINKPGTTKKESIYNHETEIELVGEQFTYKAKPPKQIIISINHQPDDLINILKTFGTDGVNNLNEKLSISTEPSLLSFKPASLLKSQEFIDWLEMELIWNIPSSINAIVYKEDGASHDLAIKVRIHISKLRGEHQEIEIIECSDLSKTRLEKCRGILVVSAFSGDGGQLRQISRDLREFEKEIIPRHFLIGVGIPQSNDAWGNLRKFLIRNATNREYGFSAWKVLPLGPDVISKSWELLIDYSSNLEVSKITHDKFDQNDIEEWQSKLSKTINESAKSLLPNVDDIPLELTSGFVFFGDELKGENNKASQSVVMMTISSVLQAAREHKNPEICLRPSNYQSVVLSPENFLRYNDDILQACLLRASLPSEIDYSSNHDLSVLMQEFLFKVFSRHEHAFGYSALEFAAALATGKLKLRDEHTLKLIDKVLEIPNQKLNRLMIFLLSVRNNLEGSISSKKF